MQMTLAKSDMRIAETYTSLAGDIGVRDRIWGRVSEEQQCASTLCSGSPDREPA